MTGKKSSIESVLDPYQDLCKFLKVMERYVDGEIDMGRARELLGMDPKRLSEPRITYWMDLFRFEPVFEVSDDQGVRPLRFHEDVEELSTVEMIHLLRRWEWIDQEREDELMDMLREQKIREMVNPEVMEGKTGIVTSVEPPKEASTVDRDLRALQDFYSREIEGNRN